MPPPARDPPPTAWHRLDPLTRLTVSIAAVVGVVALGGIACPMLLGLVAVVAPAVVARELPGVLGRGLVLALPLALSVVVVTLLFGDVSLESRVRLAAEVVIRVLTMAGAVVLFYLTTRPSELVASLQQHGAPARATFVLHNAVAMIPRLAERAQEVAEAQRARGFDTEGSWWRRGRGVIALAAPTVLGTLREVETRSLALETRGFTRPGRRTLLWAPADSPAQRLARWLIVAGVAGLLVARIAGMTLPC